MATRAERRLSAAEWALTSRKSITSHLSSGRVSLLDGRRTTIVDTRPFAVRRKAYYGISTAGLQIGSFLLAISLSISCAVMGAINWTKCPGNKILPVLLVLKAPLICTELGAAYIILARNYEWVRKQVTGECMNNIHTVTGFLFISSGIWFSILALWVFESGVSYNPRDQNYCQPHFHKFVLGYVSTVLLLAVLLIFTFFIACIALAVLLIVNNRLKSNGPEVKRTKKPSMVTYGETSFAPDNFSK